MSRRNRIINYVTDLLKEHEQAFGPIYTSHVRAMDLETLPCVIVSIPHESSEVASQSPLEFLNQADLVIQVLIEGNEDSELLLHELADQVSNILMMDDSLGDTVSRIQPATLEITTNFEGESPLGAAILRYSVTYYEQAKTREELISDLSTLSLKIGLRGL